MEVRGGEASFVLEGCGIQVMQRRGVPREVTARKCCRMAFLRGVFLASGSVTDPEKEYHLDFVLGDEAFALALQYLVPGAVLCWTYERSGSLWSAVAVHAAANALCLWTG